MKLTIPAAALLLLCACTAVQIPNGETIEIFKHDGSRQCEGGGISPETMQHELRGITVHAAYRATRQNIAFAAVCGGGTPHINVYRINQQDWPQARQRGFQLMTPLDKGEIPSK